MVVLHQLGEVVYLLLDLVGFVHNLHIFSLIGFDGLAVEPVDKAVQGRYLGQRLLGESKAGRGEGLRVLDYVLGIVSDALYVPYRAEGGREVNVVPLVKTAAVRELHHEVHKGAVDVVDFFLGFVESLPVAEVQGGDNLYRAVEVQHRKLGHPDDLFLGLSHGERGSAEHVAVHVLEPESLVFCLPGLGDHSAHKLYKCLIQREYENHREHIEDGVEHRELGLGRSGEHSFEKDAETGAGQREQQGDEKEYQHSGAVEQQVDEGGALGVDAAGHTGYDGNDAGADVGSHRKVDTLVQADEPCHYHGEGDGGHHRGALDDGRQDGAEDYQKYGVAYAGKEGLDAFEGGEILHRTAHQAESDEEHSESGKYSAPGLGAALFGEQHHKGSQSGKGREDDGGGDGVSAAEHTQRDYLGGDCGTYVRAVNNGGGLAQGDDAGVHEAYGHHRCGSGTLDGGGADGSYAYSEEFALGCFGEKFLKPAGAG